jgi:3-phosphoshikimate 1-carboxyvinyltransferase
MPRLVDEVPILALAATQAQGTTEIRGAAELRVKESDRLAHIARGLSQNGAAGRGTARRASHRGAHAPARGAVGFGGGPPVGHDVRHGGLIAEGETEIADADCVEISFPTFWEDLERVRVQA